jgi:hypothetical protein
VREREWHRWPVVYKLNFESSFEMSSRDFMIGGGEEGEPDTVST